MNKDPDSKYRQVKLDDQMVDALKYYTGEEKTSEALFAAVGAFLLHEAGSDLIKKEKRKKVCAK